MLDLSDQIISATFCARECCCVESMTTFCRSLMRELSWGTKPYKLEETSQPWLNEWPSTMCSFELLSLALYSYNESPGDSPARRGCSSSLDARVWVEKHIVEKTKQKTPREHCVVATSSSRGVPLCYPGDCIASFLNTLIFSFFVKIFKTVVSKQVISQAILYFLKVYTVGRDHSLWFGFFSCVSGFFETRKA